MRALLLSVVVSLAVTIDANLYPGLVTFFQFEKADQYALSMTDSSGHDVVGMIAQLGTAQIFSNGLQLSTEKFTINTETHIPGDFVVIVTFNIALTKSFRLVVNKGLGVFLTLQINNGFWELCSGDGLCFNTDIALTSATDSIIMSHNSINNQVTIYASGSIFGPYTLFYYDNSAVSTVAIDSNSVTIQRIQIFNYLVSDPVGHYLKSYDTKTFTESDITGSISPVTILPYTSSSIIYKYDLTQYDHGRIKFVFSEVNLVSDCTQNNLTIIQDLTHNIAAKVFCMGDEVPFTFISQTNEVTLNYQSGIASSFAFKASISLGEEDNCASGDNFCIETAICMNTVSSVPYECLCKNGYFGSGRSDHDGCTDINECEGFQNTCHKYAMCSNTEGSYTCTCGEGFGGDGYSCNDKDECVSNPCGYLATCANTIGSYMCSCPPGYSEEDDHCISKLCESAECMENSHCIELNNGKYDCECDSGFHPLKDGQCGDDDECDTTTECDITANFMCKNTPGSYTCVCMDGYKETVVGECVQKDYCKEKRHRCPVHAFCVNENSMAKCHCDDGFEMSDGTCIDVNECNNTADCNTKKSFCVNIYGSYECICLKGFSKDDGGNCMDINECEDDDLCEGNTRCVNLNGIWVCKCLPGFHGPNCTDTDECQQKWCHKSARCHNTPGAFECRCEEDEVALPPTNDVTTQCHNASVWNEWHFEGDCTKSCGEGSIKMVRTCSFNGLGTPCDGDGEKSVPCNTHSCGQTAGVLKTHRCTDEYITYIVQQITNAEELHSYVGEVDGELVRGIGGHVRKLQEKELKCGTIAMKTSKFSIKKHLKDVERELTRIDGIREKMILAFECNTVESTRQLLKTAYTELVGDRLTLRLAHALLSNLHKIVDFCEPSLGKMFVREVDRKQLPSPKGYSGWTL